jgi:peptidylprolyl isomerase
MHAVARGARLVPPRLLCRSLAGRASRVGKRAGNKVFLDIAISHKPVGTIVIELATDEAPRAAENFRALCRGDRGLGRAGRPLHYQGSKFHRVIPGFMAQGGDITNGDGSGGESIYGPTFADEDTSITHSSAGIVSMANEGPDTNASQFFIVSTSTLGRCRRQDGSQTFAPAPWLDGSHVAIGRGT